ncbi:variable large family protein [Borrelia duttonii]|uniref:Variable large protein n=1 Tax=Borrelia duttonii (strain Ly) TaxID=412419 RepID=B5RPC8_BORDL|nr:vlp protein, beta subfamily [Borrelia duttonii Ly]
MNIEKKGEGKVRVVILMVMMIVMMMGCNSGGVSGEGKVNLEAKNSFLESLVKIGEGFQEIFAGFGSAIGDVLGFNVVKVGDNRSKVGEHFKKVGEGLTTTKNKLNELKVKISEVKNVDGSTIKVVEDAIKGASDVFEQLIASLTKLAGVTSASVPLGDANNGAVGADKVSVDTVIESVKEIVEVAIDSGIKIVSGSDGGATVVNGNGPNALAGNDNAGAGDKLADEVSKADSWAMIDKIKNAQTKNGAAAAGDAAGELATGTGAAGVTAKTNADLAAAVALKAMTKGGKFSVNNADSVKGAAANAVNKVLVILDVLIGKTVAINLDKIRETVKALKYSETSGIEAGQSGTVQSVVTK